MMSLLHRKTKMRAIPASATYVQREIIWVPADPNNPDSERHVGNMTIMLRKSTKVGSHVEADTYGVEEMPPEPGIPGRVFLVTNYTDDEQDEPYKVIVGRLTNCTCKAGKCRVSSGCKHVHAIQELILRGDIPNEWQRSAQELKQTEDAIAPLPPDHHWDNGPMPGGALTLCPF